MSTLREKYTETLAEMSGKYESFQIDKLQLYSTVKGKPRQYEGFVRLTECDMNDEDMMIHLFLVKAHKWVITCTDIDTALEKADDILNEDS